jgi:DNA-binding NarL/FixJ family response regulator
LRGRFRIVIADDHTLFRQGLKGLLEDVSELEVVGEAGDGLELIRFLEANASSLPDLIVLDLSMPNLRGMEVIPKIKKIHSGMKILIVTMHKDPDYLYQALASGADGFFLKNDTETELFSAIEGIRQGKIYVSPQFADNLTQNWEKIREGFRPSLLTVREKEIVKLIAEGKSNKEVAAVLSISVHTVERHRANVMAKLNLKKTADLVKYAIHKGLIST